MDFKCIKSAVVTSSAYCLQDVNRKILQLIESDDKIQYDKEFNKSKKFCWERFSNNKAQL